MKNYEQYLNDINKVDVSSDGKEMWKDFKQDDFYRQKTIAFLNELKKDNNLPQARKDKIAETFLFILTAKHIDRFNLWKRLDQEKESVKNEINATRDKNKNTHVNNIKEWKEWVLTKFVKLAKVPLYWAVALISKLDYPDEDQSKNNYMSNFWKWMVDELLALPEVAAMVLENPSKLKDIIAWLKDIKWLLKAVWESFTDIALSPNPYKKWRSMTNILLTVIWFGWAKAAVWWAFKKITWKAAKETAENVAKETLEVSAKKTIRKATAETVESVRVAKQVSKNTTKEVVKDIADNSVEKAGKEVGTVATKETAEKAVKETAEKATKEATETATKETVESTTKKAWRAKEVAKEYVEKKASFNAKQIAKEFDFSKQIENIKDVISKWDKDLEKLLKTKWYSKAVDELVESWSKEFIEKNASKFEELAKLKQIKEELYNKFDTWPSNAKIITKEAQEAAEKLMKAEELLKKEFAESVEKTVKEWVWKKALEANLWVITKWKRLVAPKAAELTDVLKWLSKNISNSMKWVFEKFKIVDVASLKEILKTRPKELLEAMKEAKILKQISESKIIDNKLTKWIAKWYKNAWEIVYHNPNNVLIASVFSTIWLDNAKQEEIDEITASLWNMFEDNTSIDDINFDTVTESQETVINRDISWLDDEISVVLSENKTQIVDLEHLTTITWYLVELKQTNPEILSYTTLAWSENIKQLQKILWFTWSMVDWKIWNKTIAKLKNLVTQNVA